METHFIGFDSVARLEYRTTRDEATRCYFCKNKCLRTFIDVKTDSPPPSGSTNGKHVSLSSQILKTGPEQGHPTRIRHGAPLDPAEKAAEVVKKASTKSKSKIPLGPGEQRLIIATCEKGTVEDISDMREIKGGLDAVKKANPNYVEIAARDVFKDVKVDRVADELPKASLFNPLRKKQIEQRRARMERRESLRIGFPRVLNMYSQAPFFIGFFKSLGVPFRNIVFSDYTTEELYKRGAKRGSIDPCFPSKLGIPHVHDLLQVQHKKKPLTHIFFPMVDSFPTFLDNVQASKACPTVVTTAEAAHAAFIKEGDLFKERGIVFKKTFLNLDVPALAAQQMFEDWGDELGLSHNEACRASAEGLRVYSEFLTEMRRRSRETLDVLAAEDRIGVVILARPYHNDPGINHDICEELQKLGYPIFWQDALPIDEDILEELFGEEVRQGTFKSALSIDDVWKNSYSENTSRKAWAAKYAARHPNLIALELSNFKCGHDAPIYSVIEEIIEKSGTPYFCFKDIDENKPTGAIKIRIETIAYFLKRYRERLVAQKGKLADIEAQLAQFEQKLRDEQTSPSVLEPNLITV